MPKYFELLALTVIRYDDQISELINRDPKRRWNEHNPHPFISAINQAHTQAGVSPLERAAWIAESKSAYVLRNFNGLPLRMLPQADGQSVCIDARTMIESVSDVTRVVQANQHSLFSLRNEIKETNRNVIVIQQQQKEMMGMMQKLLDSRPPSTTAPATLSPSTSTMHAPPPPSWLCVKQNLEVATCPRKKFIIWHSQQGELSYYRWMNNPDTPSEERSAQVKCRQNFSTFSTKMEKLAGTSIPRRPVVGTDELLEWDAIVRSVASSGYEKAKLLLKVQSPPYSKIRDMKLSLLDD